jgi:imidazolonepropionase-like amidohydrolase
VPESVRRGGPATEPRSADGKQHLEFVNTGRLLRTNCNQHTLAGSFFSFDQPFQRSNACLPATVVQAVQRQQRNIGLVEFVNSTVTLTAAGRVGMARRLSRLLVVASLVMACAAILATQSKAIAVTNVTLIDGTGARPRVVTIIVEGDRIVAINSGGPERMPAGATIVDGRGKYMIPGMWDMHVHIGGYDEGAKLLPRFVGYGVTGMRDMASPVDDILRLRRATAEGTLLGPRIVAAGPILQRPLPFATPPLVRTVTGADAKHAVDDLQTKGVDFIKIGDTLTRDAYFGIATEAKRLGLSFAGHLPVSVTAVEATSAGQRSIEHFGSAGFRNVLIACSSAETELMSQARDALASALAGGPSPDETLYRAQFLRRLVETYDRRKAAALFEAFKQNGTWQVPTLSALASVWNARRAQLNPADAAAVDNASRKTIEMFAEMRQAGVKVLAGSDLPVTTGAPPIHDELVALVRAGMSPLEALQASTRNAAEFLGRVADEGTVEVGKKANMALLDADPLTDVANTRRVAAVVLRGRLISGSDLQRLR